MPEQDGNAPTPKPKRSLAGRLARVVLLLIGPIALAGVGAYYYVITGRYVTTENAYVKAEIVTISANVDGQVTQVLVGDNESVAAGQPLFDELSTGRRSTGIAAVERVAEWTVEVGVQTRAAPSTLEAERARLASEVVPRWTSRGAPSDLVDRTLDVLHALEAAGAACVELGVPFSDPIADGPILQAAAQRAQGEPHSR